MQKILNIIFWIAISFIAIMLAAALLLRILPINFTSSDDENFFGTVAYLGLPIAIILTLTGTIKRANSAGAIVAKAVLTLLVAFIAVIFALGSAFNFCGWITIKTLFAKKNDSASKIILRDFDCGALDGTSKDHTVVKIRHLTSHLIWISNIDTTKIDRTVWIRVDN